ncbi:hypothetical protein AX774_g667 [Zancudomyces culisetae]|uniref:Uncharacterized protein n=1 Tax=Zancudomyces culisetae TaxID=1213189 RepID=A0A1R1PXZ5_ZANCU|nr:hypothetical protein AX774_g667 [Zancudomyces culisetae]|eukprot:OMH85792.1 hypothetical protein AX774_g667 [Zancudomyces culisetae]
MNFSGREDLQAAHGDLTLYQEKVGILHQEGQSRQQGVILGDTGIVAAPDPDPFLEVLLVSIHRITNEGGQVPCAIDLEAGVIAQGVVPARAGDSGVQIVGTIATVHDSGRQAEASAERDDGTLLHPDNMRLLPSAIPRKGGFLATLTILLLD